MNLAGWMKDIRHAVVSTTTATSQQAAQEAPPRPAAPPPPVVPPQPVTAPSVAAPPPYAPTAQPVQPEPATAAAPEPAPVPQPEPVPVPVQAQVPAGYGPTYNLTPAPAPVPEPPRPAKKRRTGLILGSVAAVLVLASLAVVGVRLLGDKENAAGGEKPGGTSAPQAPASASSPSARATETESADPTPSEPSPGGSAGPEASSSPGTPGSVKDSNVADLTVLSSVGAVRHFEVGSAKLNTKEYGAALLGSCYYGATIEYDVNRAWSTLEFTVGVDDGSTMEQARVTISVDDKPALFSEAVHLGKPVTKSLDIKGALRLRLKVEEGCRNSGNAVIAAPVLKR